jgi:hypothetical protein
MGKIPTYKQNNIPDYKNQTLGESSIFLGKQLDASFS